MTLATQESKSSEISKSWLPFSLSVRFAISIAGVSIFWWLASRHDVHQLHFVPAFKDRLAQAAPALIEGAVGFAFTIWFFILTVEYKVRSTPKLAVTSATIDSLQPEKSRKWMSWKLLAFAIWLSVGLLYFGADYIKYLWPLCPPWVDKASRGSFDLIMFIMFFFDIVLENKKKSVKREAGSTAPEESWLSSKRIKLLILFLASIGLLIVLVKPMKTQWPTHWSEIMTVSAILLSTAFALLFERIKSLENEATSFGTLARNNVAVGNIHGRKKWTAVLIWLYLAVVMLVMISPVSSTVKTVAFFGAIGLVIISAVSIAKLKYRIYQIGQAGAYDRALQMNRKWSNLPFYGSSLEGPILFNAGRYSEALEFLKPSAFDSYGKPRLTSIEFYTYALALENSEHEEEAEKLLEAAISVPQKSHGMHVALATCLLGQNKESERACALLQEALAGSQLLPQADKVRRIARYAWALAACGRRQETEARIQEALGEAAKLKDCDQATVHYFVGEAWRTLGETTRARAAFAEAMRLAPTGVTVLSVRKAIAKMDGTWTGRTFRNA